MNFNIISRTIYISLWYIALIVLFVSYFKIIEQRPVLILGSEAGVHQIAVSVTPLPQATIVEHLQLVGYDKGNHAVSKTFLELYSIVLIGKFFIYFHPQKYHFFADTGKFWVTKVEQ